ncbi:MAG: EamA family transporter [Acidobacteria bacterium]|nr:EamA family transporter [Acidobacteriota bacterium]
MRKDTMSFAVGHPLPPVWMLVAAFAAVYIIWGSTFLAILFGLETIPPFLMAGTRFLVAGGLLFGWAQLNGAGWPTLAQWRSAAVLGAAMLLIGNGAVVWSEQRIPTGITALLITTEPLWIVLLEWVMEKQRPTALTWGGLVLGTVGTIVLIGPGVFQGMSDVDLLGAAAVTIGALSWAAGSLYSARAEMPASPTLSTGIQMLAGGVFLSIFSLMMGEWTHFEVAKVSLKSVLALGYLAVFGSIIAYTAYVWLTRVAPPSRVATYAYVNPIIAVLLGWAVLNEHISFRTMCAAAMMITAVVLITLGKRTVAKQKIIEETTVDEKSLPEAAV